MSPKKSTSNSDAVETVAVDELHFDPKNPRLPMKLRAAGDNEVFSFLLRECSLIELMLSIGAQGFFRGEPLLVVPRKGGGYVVVEGNRRLAAVKLLNSEDDPPIFLKQVAAAREAADFNPEELPVIKFKDRDEILTYLGYRHITGVNEWGALEKARYLDQLSKRYKKNDPERFKILAKEIGSRADYVAQTLSALQLVEKANDLGFFGKNKLDPDSIPFSLLTTALSYGAICKFIGLESREDVDGEAVSDARLQELLYWLFVEEKGGKTRIGESRNLREFARVVANKTALSKFRDGFSLEEADLFTEGPLILIRKMLDEAGRKLSTALDNLKFADGLGKSDVDKAKSIERSSKHLRASIEESATFEADD